MTTFTWSNCFPVNLSKAVAYFEDGPIKTSFPEPSFPPEIKPNILKKLAISVEFSKIMEVFKYFIFQSVYVTNSITIQI